MIILKADNITAGYTKEVNILYDVDIRLKSGQIVTIIGPNGAGKSTLLKTIFGLLKPSNGKITLKEEDITGLKPSRRRGRETDSPSPPCAQRADVRLRGFRRCRPRGSYRGDSFRVSPA